ncbi:hypothetical protein SK128_023985 [Halocaridina rubra]|uniref:G-protein coupled receptors family 1 profile domain-containing protein n=1 Tax=Halocaridina rubra TaxID=373956 RepID=A0AAN9A335_HALRR
MNSGISSMKPENVSEIVSKRVTSVLESDPTITATATNPQSFSSTYSPVLASTQTSRSTLSSTDYLISTESIPASSLSLHQPIEDINENATSTDLSITEYYLGEFGYVTCYEVKNSSLCLPLPDYSDHINSISDLEYFVHYLLYSPIIALSVLDVCVFTAYYAYDVLLTENKVWEISGDNYTLIHNMTIINICLPIFLQYSHCKPENEFIQCVDDHITYILFMGDECMLHSLNDGDDLSTLAELSLLKKDIQFYTEICEGDFKIIKEIIDGLLVIITSPYKDFYKEYFGYIANSYITTEDDANITRNKYWPYCYTNYEIIWTQNPASFGLSRDWSYLPTECKIGEIFNITFAGIVALTGAIGNLIVLTVMINGGHRNEPSCFLRTSLSLADFLTSTIVSGSAFKDSISIIYKPVTLRSYFTLVPTVTGVNGSITLVESERFNYDEEKVKHLPLTSIVNYNEDVRSSNGSFPRYYAPAYYTSFAYSDDWFCVIRGQVLCLTSCVTMIMMFFLSLERLLLTWRPFLYKRLYTLPRVTVTLILSWAFGVIAVFLISYGEYTMVYWNSWTKMLLGFRDHLAISHTPFTVISIMLSILGVFTVIFSVLALIIFLRKQAALETEWKKLDMRVTGNFKKENLYISLSLVIITALYIIAYTPVAVTVLGHYDKVRETEYPLVMFFSWWLLMGGSATNPFVYCMRSHLFQSDLAELLYKMLPKPWKRKIKPYITHSPNKLNNFLKTLDEDAAINGDTNDHGGLPKGSKLAQIGLGYETRPKDTVV